MGVYAPRANAVLTSSITHYHRKGGRKNLLIDTSARRQCSAINGREMWHSLRMGVPGADKPVSDFVRRDYLRLASSSVEF
jgi:hypothetical protein